MRQEGQKSVVARPGVQVPGGGDRGSQLKKAYRWDSVARTTNIPSVGHWKHSSCPVFQCVFFERFDRNCASMGMRQPRRIPRLPRLEMLIYGCPWYGPVQCCHFFKSRRLRIFSTEKNRFEWLAPKSAQLGGKSSERGKTEFIKKGKYFGQSYLIPKNMNFLVL